MRKGEKKKKSITNWDDIHNHTIIMYENNKRAAPNQEEGKKKKTISLRRHFNPGSANWDVMSERGEKKMCTIMHSIGI